MVSPTTVVYTRTVTITGYTQAPLLQLDFQQRSISSDSISLSTTDFQRTHPQHPIHNDDNLNHDPQAETTPPPPPPPDAHTCRPCSSIFLLLSLIVPLIYFSSSRTSLSHIIQSVVLLPAVVFAVSCQRGGSETFKADRSSRSETKFVE